MWKSDDRSLRKWRIPDQGRWIVDHLLRRMELALSGIAHVQQRLEQVTQGDPMVQLVRTFRGIGPGPCSDRTLCGAPEYAFTRNVRHRIPVSSNVLLGDSPMDESGVSPTRKWVSFR